MTGIRIAGSAVVPSSSLPYVILELGDPDPPGFYYNIWRVIDGVPTRLTEFTFNTGLQPELDNPRLSPNGQWVACDANFFNASPFGSGLIVVPANSVTADGDEIVVYSDGGDGDWVLHPSWHPDNDQIIFTHGPLALMPEGGFAGSVCRAERTNPGAALTELWVPAMPTTPQNEGAFRPTYSPDGTKIAFIVNVDGSAPWDDARNGLWVMDADGSNDVQIRNWPSDTNQAYQFRGTQLSWSPDGEWIAFRPGGFGSADDFGLYKIRPDGTDELQLAPGHPDNASRTWINNHSAWFDDDYLVATMTDTGLGWEIHRVEADGSGTTMLVDGVSVESVAGADYFRQVYYNHMNNRLEWISDTNPGVVRTAAIDGTDIVLAHDITVGDPANPGNPVGDVFYSGTGHDWL